MATWSQSIGEADYAAVGPQLTLVEGSQLSYAIALSSAGGAAHDLTGWTLAAGCSFHTAASLARGPYPTMMAGGAAVPDASIPVRKANQDELPGTAWLDIPSTLLPSAYDVPPNANPFPLALAWVTMRSPETPPEIFILRFPIVWRDRDGR